MQDLYSAQKELEAKNTKKKEFVDEVRYIHSEKAKVKVKLQEKRKVLE